MRPADAALLKEKLDALARTYDESYLATDPLGVAHAYESGADREVAAFISAALAFGGAAAIRRSAGRVLERLGPRPAAALRRLSPRKSARLFDGVRHRWVGPEALGLLAHALGAALKREGSLEALFLRGYRPEEETLQGALKTFRDALLGALPARAENPGVERGARYLLPDPAGGGACKRLHLFLRWMIRPADGLDLGLWKAPGTHQLVIPLDTHVARIGRLLGLTDRKTPDMRMALEITRNLRRIDPADPVRYDFAISRMGILGHCPSRRNVRLCAGCPLQDACRYWRRLQGRRKGAARGGERPRAVAGGANPLGYSEIHADSGGGRLPTNIKRIALAARPEAQKSPLDFAALAAWLRERGFETRLDADTAKMAGEKTGAPRDEVVREADLVIVFGGDGSMLRAAHSVEGDSPLLLGINTGHLGFLADVPQADLYPALERILIEREFSIESRMRLTASARKNGETPKLADSLNDVVLTTGPLARMVEYRIDMEGRHLGYFRADGLIVATPTGSTAYSLSAGGPLVLPDMNVMLINPICPHTLSNRPIVAPAEAALEITIFPDTEAQGREVLLTLDGFPGCELEAGDSVRIRKSRSPARIIRPKGADFFGTLREKLLWETHPRGGRRA